MRLYVPHAYLKLSRMDEQKFSFSGSFQKTKEYLDTQIELIKLKAIAKSSRILGAVVLDVMKVLLTLIIVFFFSLALGFYLGELMGSHALGFLTTGGIFLVLLLLLRVLEPRLEEMFMNLTIRKVLGKWNEEEEHLEDHFSAMEKEELKDIVEELSTTTTIKETLKSQEENEDKNN